MSLEEFSQYVPDQVEDFSASGTLPTSRVDMASECLQLAEDAKAENDAITPNLNVIGSKLKTLRWFISDANGGFEWMIMRGD